ncbi:MAG: carboxypeptidase-like regulatory domain-containing protein [Longimicrobiales bacterium]|nr:carboxypeptidase-like regulatory domain-containing protein [Longimicrobiales bacterium]
MTMARRLAGIALAASLASSPTAVSSQVIAGRVLDGENGAGVGLAAIVVLDRERNPLLTRAADAQGGFRVEFPGPGEYYLIFDRLGYFETETPLLAVGADGNYAVDVEMRPEPLRLDPLQVTVSNEELAEFLTLSFGQHPATLRGYRSIQGIRLEEAKLESDDNTDLLRNLYIPVSHGINVCIGAFPGGAALPARMGYERIMAQGESQDVPASCGALYVDGFRCPNEHLEEIEMERIAVVVTLEGAVHLYTREFDWTFRPGGGLPAC